MTQAGVGTANDESLVSEQLAALESSVKNKTDKVKLIKSDIKMSAVITDFAEEIYNEAKTTTQRKKAVEGAIVFWNIIVMFAMTDKPEVQQKIMDKIKRQLPLDQMGGEKPFKVLLAYYTARKQFMFPELQTIIMDYKIDTDRDGEVYFSVVFAPASEIKLDDLLAD